MDEEITVMEGMFRLYRAIRNHERIELSSKYFSKKLLLALYEDGAFSPSRFNNYDGYNDYEFLLDMFNKRNNHHDSEDAVHQAFVSIIKHISKINNIDSPKTRSFIVLITERKAIDIMRTSHRDRVVELNEAITGIDIPLPGDHGIADAISRLPAEYREILILKFDNGFSNKELAQMIGISESGIRKLIGRARKALKAELDKEGVWF